MISTCSGSWPQYRALEARTHLARLPEDERQQAADLIDQLGIPADDAYATIKHLAELDASVRQRIWERGRGDQVLELPEHDESGEQDGGDQETETANRDDCEVELRLFLSPHHPILSP